MTSPNRAVTAEELLEMSSLGKRYELVKGGLVEMEPTGGRHGQVTTRMAWLLEEHVRSRSLGTVFTGEPGFQLERGPDTVLAPDVAFVAAERLSPEAIPDTYPDLAPDLVVEIMSPSDTHPALDRKAGVWIELGARVVWVVDPKARRILVHEAGGVRVLSGGDHLTGDPVLPEFHCPVRRVFEA